MVVTRPIRTEHTASALPRRRSVLVGGAATLLLGAVLAVTLWPGGDDKPKYPVVNLTPVNHEVRYEVDGAFATAPVLSWIIGDDNKEKSELDVPLPWSQTVEIPVGPAGSHANIEVASPQNGVGSISCRMFVDGVQVAQQTASDGFTGVACSALIPPTYVK